MRKKFRYFLIGLVALGAGLLPTASCTGTGYRYCEGAVWNTLYHITFDGPQQLADSVMPVLEEVGRSVSVFDTSSLVSRLNGADSIKTDHHLTKVYLTSLEVNRHSGGVFDPTLSPLITAWGFGKGHAASADTLRLDSLLALTGIARTRLTDAGYIVKPVSGMQFNFSAIAKGYGCDAVAAMLRRNGVRNFLIEIGGEIRCAGVNASGRKWHISIDRPLVEKKGVTHDSQQVLELTDCGLATSGNYRNFHKSADGRLYGHTISPQTGRPVATDLLSATVIASDAMHADAYATACMALGSSKARQMLRRLGLKGVLVLADSTVINI